MACRRHLFARLVLVIAALLFSPAAASDEFVLGIYGPLTSVSTTYLATAVAFDIDFQKHFNPALVTRFGPPIVTVPNLNPALKLKTQIGTSNSNSEVGMRMALDMFQGLNGQETIHGLVGGYHSAISMPIAQLATQFKLPQVSWGSTSPRLSNKDNYPWFLRTIPPDSIQSKAMWGFIGHFQVPSVTFTYAQEAYGEGLFGSIVDQASAAGEGFRIAGVGVRYMPSNYDMDEARTKAARILGMGSKIVMLAMTADQAQKFSEALDEAGMIGSGAWQFIGSEAVQAQLVPVLNIVGYTYFSPVSRAALFDNFAARLWTQLTPDDVHGPAARSQYKIDKFAISLEDAQVQEGVAMVTDATFADISSIGLEEPFMFDAAYAFVQAINALLNQGVALADIKGQQLLDALYAVSFEGISGQVAFDAQGDRAASYTFDNVRPSGAGRRLAQATTVAAAGSYSAATGAITMDMQLYWMTGDVGNAVPDALASCEPGFWKDSEGASPTRMCYECEPGTISAGGTASRCDPCPAGRAANVGRGATECIDCDAGHFSAESKSTHCSQCLPGFYQESSASIRCDQCKAGTFASGLSQTACVSCSEGKLHPELYSTQQQVEVHGKAKWVPFAGATSSASCGCSEGAYEKDGNCMECSKGMICPGMGEVFLEPSYFATVDDPGFVFRCFGNDHLRCPGGLPGTCAFGRLNSTLACTSCSERMRPSDGGACEDCGGADTLPFVAALLLCMLFTILLYRAVDTENPASRNRGLVLVAITGSQTVTLFQQMGVFGSISLEWPSPFKDLIEFLSIFTFNLDYLYLDCLTTVDPVSKFVGRVFTVFGFFTFMVIVHIVSVLVLRKGAFRERTPSLVGAVGTIFSAFFISIVSSMLSPFQCNRSPNDVRTVNEYHSVVCYDSSYGSAHGAMMGIGIAACTVPLAFLSVVAYIVWALPTKLATGDTRFLHSFAFLFFRFRPGAFWFALVFLVRNLLISLVPAIGEPVTQILIMQCIIIPLLMLTVHTKPWVLEAANAMDVANNALLSMLLIIFALFTTEIDPTAMATLCCVVFALAVVVLLAAVLIGAYLRLIRSGKAFQFFICHHKAGAGNFARLLKMHLVAMPQVTRKVFVDSDDLRDLGSLFATVASDLETLVVVCSKEILSRPWCMGEVTTSKVSSVNVVKVILPDFVWPGDDFITRYEEHVPDAVTLTKHGLGLDLVKESIRWLNSQRSITFPTPVTAERITSLVGLLMKGPRLQEDVNLGDSTILTSSQVSMTKMVTATTTTSMNSKSGGKNCILADVLNMEACCTALVLQRLLRPMMQSDPEKIPIVLDDATELANNAEQICLVCTNGVFRSPHVLTQLMRATEMSLAVLPVVSEPSFRFPTKDFLEALQREGGDNMKRLGLGYSGYVLVKVVERIFTEIAVEVNPQDAESVLDVRAQAVARRLGGGLRKLGLDIAALEEEAAKSGNAMQWESPWEEDDLRNL